MTRFWNKVAGFYSAADAVLGNAVLEQLIGGFWIPIYTEVNAVASSAGFPTVLASEIIFSFYSTLHEKMKLVLTEAVNQGSYRYPTYASNPAGIKPLVDMISNGGGTATDADLFAWGRSRADDFPGAFTSTVGTYSKHWRRKRGLG